MASMNGIFKVGVSGLQAAQRGLDTAGHNIANINTPGFSRQSAEFVTRPAYGTGNGFIGNGVSTNTIRRIVDGFVTAELQVGTSKFSEAQTLADFSGQLDNLLASSGTSLDASMQGLFSAFSDLSTDPSSTVARDLVLSQGATLAQRFGVLEQRLSALSGGVNEVLRTSVAEINGLAGALATLNEEIARNEGRFQQQPPNDLLDQRDELVRRLAEHIDVSTIPQDNGALNVSVGSGQALVTGSRASELVVTSDPFDPSQAHVSVRVGSVTSDITAQISGGKISGALTFADTVLEPARNQVGLLAHGLSAAMNERHQLGQDLLGARGRELFTSLANTARALGHSANTGTATLALEVQSPSALSGSDYVLARSGASYSVTRQSDGQVTTLTGFPAGNVVVDGVSIGLAAGTIDDGDQFLIQPTALAAKQFAVALTDPSSLAAALPIRVTPGTANTGGAVATISVNAPSDNLKVTFGAGGTTFTVVDETSGATLLSDVTYVAGNPIAVNGVSFTISGAPGAGDTFAVVDKALSAGTNSGTGQIGGLSLSSADPNLADAVTLTFTSATTFDVTGATTGTPVTNVGFVSGAPISFNGWTVVVTGTPAVDDTFTIEPNLGAVGDNRNALALASLQTQGSLLGGTATYLDAYSQLVGDVAVSTGRAQADTAAREALLNQIQTQRDSVSGVNLDEEAANLLRYQQAYQASAEVIAIANETFDSLLAAFGR
ncbi:MAG: flagellar hook-associated protein FlgK [Gammaproteobacteria bacterium]|nr:flagellar hook-associated protein FlgK [Gammaproteobacteria bacterium]